MTAKIVEEPTYRNREYVFRDRFEAGKLLADKLRQYARTKMLLSWLCLRAEFQWAVWLRRLGVVLDMMVVRKIQIPWNTEAGFGAVTWTQNRPKRRLG